MAVIAILKLRLEDFLTRRPDNENDSLDDINDRITRTERNWCNIGTAFIPSIQEEEKNKISLMISPSGVSLAIAVVARKMTEMAVIR